MPWLAYYINMSTEARGVNSITLDLMERAVVVTVSQALCIIEVLNDKCDCPYKKDNVVT